MDPIYSQAEKRRLLAEQGRAQYGEMKNGDDDGETFVCDECGDTERSGLKTVESRTGKELCEQCADKKGQFKNARGPAYSCKQCGHSYNAHKNPEDRGSNAVGPCSECDCDQYEMSGPEKSVIENAPAYAYVGDPVKVKGEDGQWTIAEYADGVYLLRGPSGSTKRVRQDQIERVALNDQMKNASPVLSQTEQRQIAAQKYRLECANGKDDLCTCGHESSGHRYGTAECLGCDSCTKFKREMKNDRPPTEQELREYHAKNHHGKFLDCEECADIAAGEKEMKNASTKTFYVKIETVFGNVFTEIIDARDADGARRIGEAKGKVLSVDDSGNQGMGIKNAKFIPQEVNGAYCDRDSNLDYLSITGSIQTSGETCKKCGRPAVYWCVLRHEYLDIQRADEGRRKLDEQMKSMRKNATSDQLRARYKEFKNEEVSKERHEIEECAAWMRRRTFKSIEEAIKEAIREADFPAKAAKEAARLVYE